MVRGRLSEFGAEKVEVFLYLILFFYNKLFIYFLQNITDGMLYTSWFDAPHETRAQMAALKSAFPQTDYQLYSVYFGALKRLVWYFEEGCMVL